MSPSCPMGSAPEWRAQRDSPAEFHCRIWPSGELPRATAMLPPSGLRCGRWPGRSIVRRAAIPLVSRSYGWPAVSRSRSSTFATAS
jgi:hypothetical protein